MTYSMWRKHYLGWLKHHRALGMPRDTLVDAQLALVRLRAHVGPGPF